VQEVARIRAAVLRGERPPSSFECDITAADGRVVPIQVCFASARYEGVPVSVAFIQDHTEARAAQAALAASEARFRRLAEVAPDTILAISEGRVVYANPSAVAALGFESAEALMARPFTEIVVPEEVALMAERMGRVARGEQLPPIEYRGRRKDGSIVVMEISSVASVYNGRPAIVAFGRNVTERKALVERSILHGRLAAVGTLAAGVAHEINNPLSYALLNLQMLRLRAGNTPSSDTRLIDLSLEGLERVRRIVQDLLAFARPGEEIVEPVDVAQVIGASVRLARTSTLGTARVELDLEPLARVHTNRARLGQALLNVLVNALQALEDDAEGTIRVSASTRGDRLRVEVVDNGPGIAPDDLGRVFDPFFTTKPPGGGTGLGLTVSRAIMEGLGGELELWSEVGAGTRVRFELPLREPPARAPHGPRARVLVVDDEPSVASALVAYLEDEHDAVACTDPEAAAEIVLREPRWDVVLCDVRMPRVSGPELLRQVRARDPDVARRFVFLTGGIFDGRDAQLVAEAGAPVMGKPVDLAELDATIARIARQNLPS
jgi:PAS domain S-box-containing protein